MWHCIGRCRPLLFELWKLDTAGTVRIRATGASAVWFDIADRATASRGFSAAIRRSSADQR